MSDPTDWIQLYQTGFSNTTTTTQTPPITTTTTSRTNNDNPNPDHSRSSSSSSSRPIRRRSRATRRNPTTLLNTDTTNFRAMVQQFTGGPTAHFSSGPQLPGPGPNFTFTQVARPSGPHVQYPNQQQQQQQQHMSSSMMMNYNVHGGGVQAPPRPSSGDDDRSFGNYML